MVRMEGKKWKKKGKTFNQLNKKKLMKKKKEVATNVKPNNMIDQAFLPIIDSPGVSASAASPAPASSLSRAASQDKEKSKEVFKDLSGFIFLCSGETKLDCYRFSVLGLRSNKKEIVEKIKPGTKLFLFDVELKLLYGVYEATSTGKMDLEPHAFGGKFPAQVKFQIFKECLPLQECSFRHAIKDNYHGRNFEPELNGHQVRNLLSLFRPLTASATAAAVSRPLVKESPSLPNVGVPKTMPAGAVEDQDESDQQGVLAGFIFLCTAETKLDCFTYRVFGLCSSKKETIEKIKPGTKLFLFDFDMKLLYGVYEATSTGRIDLESHAFGGKFPAQVKYQKIKECLPLRESSFRDAIKDNYHGRNFEPELNGHQVRNLLSLFRPLTASATAAAVSRPLAKESPSLANVGVPKIIPAVAVEDQDESDQQGVLAGFIFLCTAETKLDCFRYHVFGLCSSKKETIEKIKPGTKLFLFDFDMKLLYGVYEATSTGNVDLESYAFGGKFPAQVKFQIFKECLPLQECSFRHAIKDNYHGRNFEPELNGHQVRNLLSLFRPLTASATAAAVSRPLAKVSPSLANVGVPKIMPAGAVEHQDESDQQGALAGFIFLCTAETKLDCFTYRVFGLCSSKKETIEKIKPGTKLFLFDFDMKLLYGVYEATSTGRIDLESHAFGGKFPAQVKYQKIKECLPLRESSFRDAIKDNYHGRNFEPELNGHQVRNLLSLFRPLTASATAAAVSRPLVKESPSLANVGVPKIRPAGAVEEKDESDQQGVLAGFIFLCTAETKLDCFRYRVFGLCSSKKETIEKIKPGTKLFLFDVDMKLLYGVYEATSTGIVDLEPLAFGGEFPAQVKFRIFRECLPLPKASFRHSITIKNFWRLSKFKPELNDRQVRKLLSLFHPLPALASAAAGPHPLTKVGQSFANVNMPKIMPSLAMEDQAKVLSYPQAKAGSSLAYVPPPNTIPALDMEHQVMYSSMATSAEDPYMTRMQHVHPPSVVESQRVFELQSAQHGWYRTANFVETARTVTEHKQFTAPSHAYSHQPYVTQGISADIQNPYLRYRSVHDGVPLQQHPMELKDRNYPLYSGVERGMLPPQESIVTHNYYSGPSAPCVPPAVQQPPQESIVTDNYYSGPSAPYVPPAMQQPPQESIVTESYYYGPSAPYVPPAMQQPPQESIVTHNYCSGPSAPYVPPAMQQPPQLSMVTHNYYSGPSAPYVPPVMQQPPQLSIVTHNYYSGPSAPYVPPVMQQYASEAVMQQRTSSMSFENSVWLTSTLACHIVDHKLRTFGANSVRICGHATVLNTNKKTLIVGGTGAYVANQNNGHNEAVDALLKSRGYQGLYSHVELSLSATGLRDRDVLSKSDPMVVIYSKGRDCSLQELARTEVVPNSLNPKWITKYTIAYHFETVQNLVFRVCDIDTQFHNQDVKMLKLEEQDFLGEASCTLSEIVTKSNGSLTLDLTRGEQSSGPTHAQKSGKLTVCAEESVASKTTVELKLRCSELVSKDLLSKSDPFLVISKTTESGMVVPICKTEVIKDDHSPNWKPVSISIQQVGSKDSPLTIECYDFNSNGKHDLIGKVQKSLADLEVLHSTGSSANLFVPAAVGQNSQNKVLKSQLFVESFFEKTQHTFLDYLTWGYELNFMVAIDFTASNGNPRLPDSLHYIDPSGRPNDYQRAILDAGEVLQFYDRDRRYPAWGFGARPIDGPVSHCFNLNGSSDYCEVEGIQGIMTAYMSALFNVSLAGPTIFGPVVTSAANIANQSLMKGEQKYFILLIITDGVITDLQETMDALVHAADLPLSVLIVGVGGADYKEMEILDADKQRLESTRGCVAVRDIVQFVPYRDVQSGDSVLQSLLAELPSQFLEYMRLKKIQPSS
ncbi:hypothetical protein RND71_006167 [Anisodus tanguticus]|uniref:Uncharacterized protein n=1 Tax=Anisodus tanguticus TaxID=243964 RepID=A0AAE1VW01_9SOLA|nr:hypothetical protein RND71_006167 [Anisodus tanguticus]